MSKSRTSKSLHRLLLLIIFFSSYTNAIAQEKKPSSGGSGNEARSKTNERPPVPVRVEVVATKVAPINLSVVAPLVGRQQVDVYSRIAGRVASLAVKEGDQIKENQLLLRIDRNDPGETFLSVPVVSPINGWLGRWNVLSIGEAITTTKPVVTVVDDSALRATIYLTSSDWLKVTKKTGVTVTVDGESRRGEVTSIARAAQSESGRGSVVVEVQNSDHTWRAGLIAKVTLDLEPRERLLIPASALFITERGAHVFTISEGEKTTAKKLEVIYALVSNDLVEISSGLKNNDTIVTAGGNLLANGTTVRVVNDEVKN